MPAAPLMRRPKYVSALGIALLVVPCWGSDDLISGYRVMSFDGNGRWKAAGPRRPNRADADRDRQALFARHRELARETASRSRKRGED